MNSGMDGHKVVWLSAIDKSLVKKGYEYESGEKRKEEKLLAELADCLYVTEGGQERGCLCLMMLDQTGCSFNKYLALGERLYC